MILTCGTSFQHLRMSSSISSFFWRAALPTQSIRLVCRIWACNLFLFAFCRDSCRNYRTTSLVVSLVEIVMVTLMIHLYQPTANPFTFWLEEYIQSIRVKYFTRHTMFNDKLIQLILGAVLTSWCMLLQMKTTLITSNTGMHGSLEYIMQRLSVLILMLWVEMRWAEWNSYGWGGLEQNLGTHMDSKGQNCRKLASCHPLMNTPLASSICDTLSVLATWYLLSPVDGQLSCFLLPRLMHAVSNMDNHNQSVTIGQIIMWTCEYR